MDRGSSEATMLRYVERYATGETAGRYLTGLSGRVAKCAPVPEHRNRIWCRHFEKLIWRPSFGDCARTTGNKRAVQGSG